MFQVYTAKDKSELSKNLIGEFKDYDDAMDLEVLSGEM